MRIIYRPWSIYNFCFYLIFSFCFFLMFGHLCELWSFGDLNGLLAFVKKYPLPLLTTGVALVSSYQLKASSMKVYILHVVCIFSYSFFLTLINFEQKLTMVFMLFLLLSFILSSYYFYHLWQQELSKACYSPKYSAEVLDPYIKSIHEAELKNEEYCLPGILTNLDHNGAFIKMDQESTHALSKVRNISLVLTLEREVLELEGRICSTLPNGFGIQFQEVLKKDDYDKWAKFCDIIFRTGLTFN